MDARTLSLPVSTLDYKQPVTVAVGSPVSMVIDLMQEERIGCVLVVGEDERLIGIITERDMLQKVSGQRAAPAAFKVEQVMTADPEALRGSDPIAYALNLMHLGRFRHLPLCVWDDQGAPYPIGIISTRDILDHIAVFIENQD